MLALQFACQRHFLELFSHKILRLASPTGNSILNAVSGQNPREIAWQVLRQRQEGVFVEDLLERALARGGLAPADRHLCQELVYGVVRGQATLDWLIARKAKAGRRKAFSDALLRLGLYQIFWLDRIPEHAAVHETVELARQSAGPALAGFVNAVLRAYLREAAETRRLLAELKTTQPDVGYSHPQWLAARWRARWGDERAAQLMAWNNAPPKTYARINLLKARPETLLPQWREEDVEYDFFRRDWFEENLVFELKSHPPLDRLPSFQAGCFYVQDPGTLLAVRELDPRPGETLLDLCAAPGGKLTYIAQLMNNQGRLVAHDNAADRLDLVRENCRRLGVTGVEAVSELPALGASPGFDRILIDAPCSNTGVMRRRVELRWRLQRGEIERLQGVQLDLLEQGARLLKPGGTLVYSTCSLEPEENEQVVTRFLEGKPSFKLEGQRELIPFADGVDGAYVAKLRARE
jgi:16S rRNA (cytosine967-C5)-methyltransferase